MLTGYEWNINGIWMEYLSFGYALQYSNMAGWEILEKSANFGHQRYEKLANGRLLTTDVLWIWGASMPSSNWHVSFSPSFFAAPASWINVISAAQVSLHGLRENGRENRGNLHEERGWDGRGEVPVDPGGAAWHCRFDGDLDFSCR